MSTLKWTALEAEIFYLVMIGLDSTPDIVQEMRSYPADKTTTLVLRMIRESKLVRGEHRTIQVPISFATHKGKGGVYEILWKGKHKHKETREWRPCYFYQCKRTGSVYSREIEDMEEHFIINGGE